MRSWAFAFLVAALALAAVRATTPAKAQGTPADSVAAANRKDADEVRAKIKGVENAPADSAFENIKVFKGLTAGQLVNAMEMGHSRALGARCTHCHVEGRYGSEDKPQKEVARAMAAMQKTINDSLLARIPDLKSKKPMVNCTTCHRGQIKPALNLR